MKQQRCVMVSHQVMSNFCFHPRDAAFELEFVADEEVLRKANVKQGRGSAAVV